MTNVSASTKRSLKPSLKLVVPSILRFYVQTAVTNAPTCFVSAHGVGQDFVRNENLNNESGANGYEEVAAQLDRIHIRGAGSPSNERDSLWRRRGFDEMNLIYQKGSRDLDSIYRAQQAFVQTIVRIHTIIRMIISHVGSL